MKQFYPFYRTVLLFSLIKLTVCLTLHAGTYYVSSNGNDSYTAAQAQNQSTPWKTISRVNQISFKSGDVVLFKRGEIFRGEIKAISGVTYGAYGAGNPPIISGTTIVSGWSLYKDKIYVASVSSIVKDLFINNKPMTLARFPNDGYLYTDSGIGITGFTDAEISQPSGYWNGADIRIATRSWCYTIGKVTSQVGTTVTFSSKNIYSVFPNYNYYFENKLNQLDAEKEWFYDTNSKKLYLYAPGGVNPSSLKIEASVFPYGFKGASVTGVVIKDFHIEKQYLNGIDITGTGNQILNNKFYFQGEHGIRFTGDNIKIEKNFFEDLQGRAIYGNSSKNSFIQYNTFNRIALKAGYGNNGSYTSTGGIVLGHATSNFKISYNTIDSIGYNGIRPDGAYHLIERNTIKYPLLTNADGGGIYAGGEASHHLTIRENFIFCPQGFAKGKAGGLVFGIYLDNLSHHNSILKNTVVGSQYGGIVMNAGNHDNVVRGNVCFNNKVSAIWINDWESAYPIYSNIIKQNIFYSTNPSTINVDLASKFGRFDFGEYDSNYYCNPYTDFSVSRGTPAYTLPQWKSLFSKDLNTKKSLYRWQSCEVSKITGSNLILNGGFNSDTKGWAYNSSTSKQEYLSSGINGGSLKFTVLSSTKGILSSPSFSGLKDKMYELKFSAKSSKIGSIKAIVRQAHSPYSTLYTKVFPLDLVINNYSHVLKMPVTDTKLRIDFEILYENQNFILDNVSLTPVEVTCHDPLERSVIFTNPSNNTTSISLNGKTYKDLNGNTVSGNISLAPWTSKILVLEPGQTPAPIPVTSITLRTPENPTNTVNGIKYSYYEGNWALLPDFNKLTPKKSGIVSSFNLTPSLRSDYFGFRYQGYISVPADGQYTFYTNSDDGSKLFIGNTLIVNNDGRHAAKELSGTIGLKTGKHLITVLYFENANGNSLSVSYAGPGITKKVIPASSLYYQTTTNARVLDPQAKEPEELKIFPNPTAEYFQIEHPEVITKINIINSQGSVYTLEEKINLTAEKIDVRHLPRGMYLLEITYSNGKKDLKRLFVEE